MQWPDHYYHWQRYKNIYNLAFAKCEELADVYCYASTVPLTTNNDAFTDSYIDYATLHVPTSSIDAYKAREPWKSFKTIMGLDGTLPDNPEPEIKKCATPTIAFVDGKLKFGCDTEDVKYVYTITPKSTSGESTNGVVNLGTSFTVSVYATREGYNDSETATAIIDMSTVGDVNGDGLISVADVTALVNLILGRN